MRPRGIYLPQRGGSQHGDLKPEAAGALGLRQMPPVAFSVRGNKVLLCMEICKDLRYNFDVGKEQQTGSWRDDPFDDF